MNKYFISTASIFLLLIKAYSQTIPVEVFSGNVRTSLDLLWFRPVEKGSKFIFSNRSRFSVDYHNQTTYGSSSNISYRFKNGLGIGAEAKINASGFTPQAGFTFFTQKNTWAIFSFLRTPLQKELKADWLTIIRWTPPVNKTLKLFIQSELAVLQSKTLESGVIRQRLGISYKSIQIGSGVDINAVNHFFNQTTIYNWGGFLRKEF